MSLNDYVAIAQLYGKQLDFIQGGGGNTSFKVDDEWMLIKASGFFLKNVQDDQGFVKVRYRPILDALRKTSVDLATRDHAYDNQMNTLIAQSTAIDPAGRASIETAMHTLLLKHVAHTHPTWLNVFLCSKTPGSLLKEILGDDFEYLLVPYYPPGVYLAKGIDLAMKNIPLPKIVFLKSHGLIVHSDEAQEVFDLTDALRKRFEVFLEKKKVQTKWDLCSDLSKMGLTRDIFPDTVVFRKFISDSLPAHKKDSITEIFSAAIYLEDAISQLGLEPEVLSSREIDYILNMESEKFRQQGLFKEK